MERNQKYQSFNKYNISDIRIGLPLKTSMFNSKQLKSIFTWVSILTQYIFCPEGGLNSRTTVYVIYSDHLILLTSHPDISLSIITDEVFGSSSVRSPGGAGVRL